MSLVQRVSSIEGFDREQLQEPQHGSTKSLRRVISYDAFPPTEESQAQRPSHAATAYKVSVAQRMAQVAFTIFACWLASGVVFGFAALKPVLIDQGVYRERCSRGELERDVKVCYEQDLSLNFFFAIASTTCNVSALPAGTILDRFGPRFATIVGSLSLALGALLMAEAFHLPQFDGYIAGNIFLALGGTFIFVPSFQIANAFPQFSGTIVAMVTGAFDASAAVYLFYRLAYQSSGGSFVPEVFFWAFTAVPVLILLAQVFLMQPGGYKTVPELEATLEKMEDSTRDVHSSDDDLSDDQVQKIRSRRQERRESKMHDLESLLGDAEFRQAKEEREEERQQMSGVWGALHGKTPMEQMLSPWFILMTLLTVLQMLRMNFFIATIRAQYEYMLGSARAAKQINTVFDIALPIGGVAATPIIGLMLDHISTVNMLALLVAMITAVGVLGSLPFMWAGYANIILFVLLRPLYYSAMSDYAAKVFGFATFGRVYGAIICFSGLINLSQPAIDAMTHDLFDSNPIPVNIALTTLGLAIGVTLVVFVSRETKRIQEEWRLEAEDNERNLLIREEDEANYGSIF